MEKLRNGARKVALQLVVLVVGLLLPQLAGGGEVRASGIIVQLQRDQHLSLHITLTSGSRATARFARNELPWSGGHNMTVAATVQEECLARELPINDSMFLEISIPPKGSLEGKIDLEALYPNITRALRERDVNLFWAYEAPEGLNLPRWSGGWILVSRQK